MEEIIRLNYEDSNLGISYSLSKGVGESIVFIHGLGCSKDFFKGVWRFPEYEKYTILAFDLLGFGNSSKPKDFSYTMEEHAEICKLAIEKLHLERIHLVGHSMGGAIGLFLIEKIGAKVISFTNLEGNLVGEDCKLSREAIRYSLEDFEKSTFQAFKYRVRHTKSLLHSTTMSKRLYYKWLSKSAPYAFYKSSESLVNWSDSGELLRMFIDLDMSKHYVFGELNKNSAVVGLLASVPKTQISSSGHFMMVDNPQEFYRGLFRILSVEYT
jgi:pimeloyl-ACP methyl ester carboxylesterase